MKLIRISAVIAACVLVALPLPAQEAPERPSVEPLPSIELPAELDRVLRDYERHWSDGDADGLVSLFTPDGMIRRRGWIQGHAALRKGLQGSGGDLRLRAVGYAVDETVAYILGAYGYGDGDPPPDRGVFILTLRRAEDGQWLITADLDASIPQ
ncbi:MAG: YybH family protein [Gemmatimonadota bacterium]